MFINNIIQTAVKAYLETDEIKKKHHDRQYNELDHTPFLFSSDYLNHLSNQANSIEDCNKIMEYLEKYECVDQDIRSYDSIYYCTLNKTNKMKGKKNES
ncbi:hypothetical protein LCM23_14700 [Cytobacillus kochii]|uniref:hypothetical protein n=1 Tax=Cytobacillus kochii TaxID=859143 RepID=UPI001CD1F0F8|nr:hypothetical protein [Cytobacillus kochii]MCA1027345.1 hypothetical protein [Cytobacillus kochii]